MSKPTEFAYPRYVKEAARHDQKFLTQTLQSVGWEALTVDEKITADQERKLFAAMHVAAYLANQHKGKTIPLTKQGREYHAIYLAIFDHMVKRNMGLIYKMVIHSHTFLPNIEDLEAESFYVLFNAVRNFNPWKGFRFSTYACNSIRNACWQLGAKYTKNLQRSQSYMDESDQSHDPNIGEEEPKELAELFMERATCLNEVERHVLKERYLTGRIKTLAEIAGPMGLSKERIRQIQNKAIHKIQEVVTPSDY